MTIRDFFRFSSLCVAWLCVGVMLESDFAFAGGPRFHVDRSAEDPQLIIKEITSAAESPGAQAPDVVELSIRSEGEPQSYRIEKDGSVVRVVGADGAGLIYGGLDVAEAIRLHKFQELKSGAHKPFIAQRGIKFNLPLDLRTPSYSDNSDAAQANIPEMWSRAFWREFLDEMARNRFNLLSLWSLNPFPSIVKVPEYPEVALNDVLRGRREAFDESFPHNGRNMYRPEFLRGAEVVKRLTIDEKIEFWNDIMRMAKERGIDVYWFTWNLFIWTEEGKHGITRAKPDGELLRYFRASVRETVKTYPLLAGMGITAGENMAQKEGTLSKEEWLWRAYGEGIRDALKEQPNRKFRFIHRLHQTGIEDIAKYWTDYPGPFDFSYKYAVAHMYGTTNPPFIKPLLPELDFFARTLAARFPEVPADKLLAGWIAASRILPELTRFFWGDIDLKWFPEACLRYPGYRGFYTVKDFINGQGMPESGDLTIRQWRERLLAKTPMDGIMPLEVAANLRRQAETAKRAVAELRPRQRPGNGRLRSEIQ